MASVRLPWRLWTSIVLRRFGSIPVRELCSVHLDDAWPPQNWSFVLRVGCARCGSNGTGVVRSRHFLTCPSCYRQVLRKFHLAAVRLLSRRLTLVRLLSTRPSSCCQRKM